MISVPEIEAQEQGEVIRGRKKQKFCVMGTFTFKLKHSKIKMYLEYFWEPVTVLLLLKNRLAQSRCMHESAVLR